MSRRRAVVSGEGQRDSDAHSLGTRGVRACRRYRDSRELQPDQLQVHLETRFEQLKVSRGRCQGRVGRRGAGGTP